MAIIREAADGTPHRVKAMAEPIDAHVLMAGLMRAHVLHAREAGSAAPVDPPVVVGYPILADTALVETDPDVQIEQLEEIYVGTGYWATGRTRSLILPDLSSIPAGATVLSAVLALYVAGEQTPRDLTVGVHRSLVQTYAGAVDCSTWNHRNHNGSVAWASGPGGAAGAEWAADPSDQVLVAGTGLIAFDVTADLVAWLAGADQYGWWLVGVEESTALTRKDIASLEAETAGLRPVLTVTYTP